MMKKHSSLIALDCDGVLLDYNAAYAALWQTVYKVPVSLVNPHAYHAIERYGLRNLEEHHWQYFKQFMNEQYWSTMPMMPGAVEAVQRLSTAGYDLICVTAMDPKFEKARLKNLQDLGFPIEKVIATGKPQNEMQSSKAQIINHLHPAAFVDDYAPYFKGISAPKTHLALLHRDRHDSPNETHPLRAMAHTEHDNLPEFVEHWLRA